MLHQSDGLHVKQINQGSVMQLSCKTGHSGRTKLINVCVFVEFNVGFPIHLPHRDNSIPSIDKRTYRYLPYVMFTQPE